MFRVFKRVLGVVTVEEHNGQIVVEGVPGHFLAEDIQQLLKTSKVGNNLFTTINRSGFTMDSYFALDLRYLLETLLATEKRLKVSRRTARQIVDQLNEKTWLKDTLDDTGTCLNFVHLNKFTLTPLDYQLKFFEHYNRIVPQYDLTGMILAAAPGSGKTFINLALSEMLESDVTIILCPKMALEKPWVDSMKALFKKEPTFWMSSSGQPYAGERYAILHYEFLDKFMAFLPQFLGKKINIALDESHNLNDVSSLRTQLFIELCRLTKTRHVIWASGTSIKAMGSESIPIFRTIDPRFNMNVQERFKKMYGKDAKKAVEVLANRMSYMTFKVEKSELKLDKPIVTNVGVKVPDGDKYTIDAVKVDMVAFIQERTNFYENRKADDQRAYDDCISLFRSTLKRGEEMGFDEYARNVKIIQTSELRDIPEVVMAANRYENGTIIPRLPNTHRKLFKEVKTIVKYVKLKIQGECLGRVLSKKRMECIRAIAEHFEYAKYIESTEKKTLIFTSYVDVLERSAEILSEKGFQPMVVYGKTNNELASIVNVYEKDKAVNPLIATFQSLSTAVPLTMADVVIMLNAPFRDYIYQQAVSRVHRLGATTQVYVYIAYMDTGTKPNLSTRSFDILRWSQEAVEKILQISNPFPIEDLAISLESNKTTADPEEHIDWLPEDLFECDEIADKSLSLPAALKQRAAGAIHNW